MILDTFKSILESIELKSDVYFGMGPKKPVKYDYIVFNRLKSHYSKDLSSITDYFEVTILREDFIPDDLDSQIIKALTEGISGLKLSATDTEYMYWKKPNTDVNVEFMRILFYKARKRC